MMFNRQSAEALAGPHFHNSLSCKFNNCNHINRPDYRALGRGPWVRCIHIFKQDVWPPSTVVCVLWLMCLDSARRLSSVVSGATWKKDETLCGSEKHVPRTWIGSVLVAPPSSCARSSHAQVLKLLRCRKSTFYILSGTVLPTWRLFFWRKRQTWRLPGGFVGDFGKQRSRMFPTYKSTYHSSALLFLSEKRVLLWQPASR